MFTKTLIPLIAVVILFMASCQSSNSVQQETDLTMPKSYLEPSDSSNSADVSWRDFFKDPYLINLIDTALQNNQEFKITMYEIEIAQNEVRARKGEYLPFLNLGGGAGADKPGRFTRNGALEANIPIEAGKQFPEPLQDYYLGGYATWEIDVWRKMRNAKKSALHRYLGSVEAKNFMQTQLISEIAQTYYELLALDNQLDIIERNIKAQQDALQIVRLEKQSARVTELAVQRFEAQVLNTRSLEFDVKQQIVETENKLNFLVGRFPQKVERTSSDFSDLLPNEIQEGLPSHLFENRPDIRQAEQNLIAAKLDVKVARANFYPSLGINAAIGLQAFNPTYLVSPESILFGLAGDLAAPLVNRNAIKAQYNTANAKQVQAIYEYEQCLLLAYMEVSNMVSRIENLQLSYDLNKQQVAALTKSIAISNNLFRSARADYMEVLLTQRDALESKFELVDLKLEQLNASIDLYRALGGGWN